MAKFRLLAEYLREIGILTDENLHVPRPATREQLALAHCSAYLDAFLAGSLDARAQRRIGLPWTPAIARRTILAVGGSLLTLDLALEHGLAAHLAGGTHHAHHDYGSGFCIFNDLAILARSAIARKQAERVLIIDCDVHQGDGTARILAGDPGVTTCSFHCAENFPYHKALSDFDIEIPRGADGRSYQRILDDHLPYIVQVVQPDLVLYDAGVDVHADDRLGYLRLSDADLWRRDESVLRLLLDLGIPTVCVIGGGYSKDLVALARRHGIIHRVAARLYEEYGLPR